MGINKITLTAFKTFKIVKGAALTIGRQQIHISFENFNYGDFCENFLKELGADSVESIDINDYENATIIHDLNKPFKGKNFKSFDFIFDGGCTEHIFNIPQVYQNIIDLLKIGGTFLGIVPNNNFSGHGFYQFSPEFFLSVFSEKYGMEIESLFLVKENSDFHEWIPINEIGYRNTTKFEGDEYVYIIVIAKKINIGLNLIDFPPQQHSYQIDYQLNLPN